MLQLAYLDPVTGSIIFQALMGVFLTAIFTVKLWYTKVKLFIGGIFGSKQATEDESFD